MSKFGPITIERCLKFRLLQNVLIIWNNSFSQNTNEIISGFLPWNFLYLPWGFQEAFDITY